MINKVRIVGAGLIGTSVGLRLKAAGSSVEILDIDVKAMNLAADLVKSEKIDQPDLIIIAVPVTVNTKIVIDQLNNNPKSIVCDFASVKSDLLLKVKELSDNPENFVSLHPMAGREINGAENARADLFEGRAWIGISDSMTATKNRAIAQNLVDVCGGTLYWLNSKDHDDLVAKISHIPQILSSLLASSLQGISSENLNLAGQGLRDITRLASADASLWSHIVAENSASIAPVIDEIVLHLQDVKENLVSKNFTKLVDFFVTGNQGKSKIPGKHGAKNRDYSYLPIVIDDKPGELARIFNECAKVLVNIEDLNIEHSPGQETGLITLALSKVDCVKLSNHLENLGFKVHPAKNR
ncbi:MAG: prephenate dehydrogenase/arogenate dehydrogenase family protein [Candidatus Nanopelagicus sp.]